MNSPAPTPPQVTTSVPLLAYRMVFLLALSGAALSTLLLYHHTLVTSTVFREPSACNLGPSFNCDAVALSIYSTWLGIPVASYGLLYCLVVAALATLRPKTHAGVEELWSVLFSVSVVGQGTAVVLFGISIVVLETFCLYCIALDLTLFFILSVTFFVVWRLSLVSSAVRIALRAMAGVVAAGCGLRADTRTRTIRLGFVSLLLVSTGILQLPSLTRHFLLPHRPQLISIFDGTAEELVRAALMNEPVSLPVIDHGTVSLRDFTLGSPEAVVTIVEFSDYECPACKRVSPILEQLVERYPGTRLVFKNYPLDINCNPAMARPLHTHACRAAVFTRCAGEQREDAFWEASRRIFAAKELGEEFFHELTHDLGLDESRLKECLRSDEARVGVMKDVMLAQELAVRSTPTIFVNGHRLPRFHPAALEELVRRFHSKRAE